MDFNVARQFMIDSQIRPSGVTEPEHVAAFENTPREAFVPKSQSTVAYSEIAIETSEGRSIWRPRDFALLVEAADPKPQDVALVIGAGAGYETALLSHLVETAIGLEESDDVVSETSDRLVSLDFDRALCVGGNLAAGLPGQAPFDLILVNGMVETVPDSWSEQLSDGGRLAVVVEERPGLGRARIYTRSGETTSYRIAFEVTPPKFEAFNKTETFTF